MLVVLGHASTILGLPEYFGAPPFGGVFRFAHAGVDFFFVISGFIILHIHYGEIGRPGASAGYVRKRFLRIFPVFWLVMALHFLLLAFNPWRDPMTALTNLLLIPVPNHPLILVVAWSLQYEILFYALFATLFFGRSSGIAMLGAWGMLCTVNFATGMLDRFPASFLFGPFNLEFFFGMSVAWLLRRWRPTLSWTCVVLGLLIFFAAGMHEAWGPPSPPDWPGHHLAYAAGAATTLYGLVGAETTGRLPRPPRWSIELGGASYSIYLMHLLIITVLLQGVCAPAGIAPPREPAFIVPAFIDLAFIAIVLAATLACWGFFRLLEQPLLAWCRRRPRPVAFGGKPA
jgi:peptidoglycan/LPS O-acetylase OafA/YrhL